MGTKTNTILHHMMFSSRSCSSTTTTTIQRLSSSRRSVEKKSSFSKTTTTTSLAARRTAARTRLQSAGGDGVVTVAEPKENGSTDDDVTAVADAVAAAEKAFEMDDATKDESPVQQKATIDPADGSVAEAAPLGDDSQLLDDAVKVFSDATAVEMINGRVAQIGWMAALYTEITQNKSLWSQVFSTRTFTLADGVSDTVTYPGAGLFLAPFVGLVVLAASLAPVLKKASPDGVTAPGNTLGPFRPEAELTNGRGAMVGLVALVLAEKFTNGNPLF